MLPWTDENRVVRVAFVGDTAGDVKKTMIEGVSGILAVLRNTDLVTAWNRSQGELTITIPQSPAAPYQREIRVTSYSSQDPNQLRGPAFHIVWIDEMAKLEDADEDPMKADTTMSNIRMSLRVGPHPHLVATGTPTGCRLVRYLRDHPNSVVHNMRSWDNAAHVAEDILEEWRRTPNTSRFARQEIYGEILEDNPEAVFFQSVIDESRVGTVRSDGTSIGLPDASDISLVLGWDPSVSSGEDSDLAGIVLTGWTPERREGGVQSGRAFTPAEAYVLADLSGRLGPSEQTRLVVRTVLEREVDDLVFESNQGADFILTQINAELATQTDSYSRRELRSKSIKYGSLKRWRYRVIKEDGVPFSFVLNAIHAQKGKQLRAEVAAMRYDSGQVHHPADGLPELEREMTGWSPMAKKSPDRADAAVYTLLHIFGAKQMIRHGPARLSAPTLTPGPLSPLDRAGRRGASIWSMDIMERRGPQ
jgi:phage terminase large subunit-like protein